MARWKNINGALQKIAGSVRIDQVLNKLSRNAISNKAVSEKFEEIENGLNLKYTQLDLLFSRAATAFTSNETLSIPHMNEYKWLYIINQFNSSKIVPVFDHEFVMNTDFLANNTMYFSKYNLRISMSANQLIASNAKSFVFGDGALNNSVWGIIRVYGIK